MAISALISDKTFLIQHKNDLEYELICATDKYNYATESLSDLSADSSETADTESPEYKAIQYEQQYWDSKKESYDSQLEIINAEIESYDKAVQTNVKSECSFTISV